MSYEANKTEAKENVTIDTSDIEANWYLKQKDETNTTACENSIDFILTREERRATAMPIRSAFYALADLASEIRQGVRHYKALAKDLKGRKYN